MFSGRGRPRRGRFRASAHSRGDGILSLFLCYDKGVRGRWNSCLWDGDRGRTSPTSQDVRTWGRMTSIGPAHTVKDSAPGPAQQPPRARAQRCSPLQGSAFLNSTLPRQKELKEHQSRGSENTSLPEVQSAGKRRREERRREPSGR